MRPWTMCFNVSVLLLVITYDIWVYQHDPSATVSQILREFFNSHPLWSFLLGMLAMHLLELGGTGVP